MMDNSSSQGTGESGKKAGRRPDRSGMVGAWILIALGVLFLLHNLVPDFNLWEYWPVILIVVGAAMLWRSWRPS